MINSWLKIFLRNLKKRPLYPLINTLGLTLGITCFILVILFVSKELSYEKWNPNLAHIYRPIRLFDNGEVWTTSPGIMVKTAKEQLPELEDAMMMNWMGSILFNSDGKKLMKGAMGTTPNFFDFYPYPFKYGTKDNLFKNENELVLSDTFAYELFGDTNPVGKTIEALFRNQPITYLITGVYKTKGYPSETQPAILKLIKETDNMDHWGNFNYMALFKFHPGTDIGSFIPKFDKFYDENTYKSWGISWEEYLKGKEERMSIENLRDIHLFSKVHMGKGANTIFILSLLAFLILVISSINFINLSISGSTQRAKEVAVRKTLGTSKTKIVLQFIFEVTLQCLFAIVISLALVEILLPLFNSLMNTELEILDPYNKWFWALGIIGLLVFIAGIFPGIYLSNFNPVKVLKGNFGRSKSGNTLKKTMIIFQFCISAIFLISAFIIKSQLDYMNNKDLGFQKDQMLFVPIQNGGETWKKMETFKQELTKLKGVERVATTTRPPGTYAGNGSNSNVDYREISYQTDMHFIDADYFPTMGIKLSEGKNFIQDWMQTDRSKFTMDSDGDTLLLNEIIVNKKLVDKFGFENPIGTEVSYWGYKGTIIGVVDNYISKGFDEGAYPALYMNYLKGDNGDWGKPSFVMIKLNNQNVKTTLNEIEKFWTTRIEPRFPFKYEFLDQNFAELFSKHERLEKLVTGLSILMIFISLLGLFAIASHTVQLRYKEVAIKKTLGASEKELVFGLIKDFILITIIALIIALPISFYLSNRWLQDFAYRIDIPIAPFLIAPIVMLTLTIAIILVQAVKALKLDLVSHLKYE